MALAGIGTPTTSRGTTSTGPRTDKVGLAPWSRTSPVAPPKRAFVDRTPERKRQALCRKARLRSLGFLGIVRVHGMGGPQSVAYFRYAHVEGMPPQIAVRLHKDLVCSALVGRTSGFDKVVQKAEARDHPARCGGTRTALAATRRYDHDCAMLAASNIDQL
jgi:hypothetical protein